MLTISLQADLASTSHHAVHMNELLDLALTVPFHVAALYKDIPQAKGQVENVIDWLPPYEATIKQLSVASVFARPNIVETDRTLLHMFHDKEMLSRTNDATRAAAEKFKSSMQQFSEEIQHRHFDEYGLSQGMPILWKRLDPCVIPFSITT